MYHVMIDLETLGVHKTAPIISGGFAVFDPHGDGMIETQAAHFNTDQQSELFNRNPSASTLAWWLRNSTEAQAKLADSLDKGSKGVLGAQLNELAEYIRTWIGSTGYVWGYGADFDVALLAGLFDAAKIPRPWHYRKVLCYRTILNVYNPVGEDWIQSAIYHDPVADAAAQVLTLQRMVRQHNLTFTSKAVA